MEVNRRGKVPSSGPALSGVFLVEVQSEDVAMITGNFNFCATHERDSLSSFSVEGEQVELEEGLFFHARWLCL